MPFFILGVCFSFQSGTIVFLAKFYSGGKYFNCKSLWQNPGLFPRKSINLTKLHILHLAEIEHFNVTSDNNCVMQTFFPHLKRLLEVFSKFQCLCLLIVFFNYLVLYCLFFLNSCNITKKNKSCFYYIFNTFVYYSISLLIYFSTFVLSI